MKITTNTKGQLAVSKAELRAFELGYIPSRPLFDSRIDKLGFFTKPIFVGKKKLSIRIAPSINNQKKRIIAAKDYYW